MPLPDLSIRRMLDAPCDLVFDAWTRPELMARWFFPGEHWTVDVTCDARLGGRYQLDMREPEGARHNQFGEYRVFERPSKLVFTWNCPELDVHDSVVTIELVAHGPRTELVLTHNLPPIAEIRKGHEEGWIGCLARLQQLLENNNGTLS